MQLPGHVRTEVGRLRQAAASVGASRAEIGGAVRNLDPSGAATALHLRASLTAQTEIRLASAVNDARDQGCSWAEMADLLGVSRASA